jgi:hypothetical protein
LILRKINARLIKALTKTFFMANMTATPQIATERTIFIKMALDAWNMYIEKTDKLIDKLSEDQLRADSAPGRNSGVYLFGHLIAVHDALFSILGLGERLYPQLDEAFLKNPDKSGHEMPSITELKEYWNTVNTRLTAHFGRISEDEWFTRHNRVSEADFEKEPHRNKLNIIINRTNHMSYHLGQMIYLESK